MKKVISLIILGTLLSFPMFAEGNKTFERNISLTEGPVFMPKGEFIFGGTISYNTFNFDDFDFLMLSGISAKTYNVTVTPNLYYSFANNMAVGIKFAYKRSMVDIGGIDLGITDDLQFSIKDWANVQQTFYGAAAYRYYMPIGQSLRFGLFTDVMLSVGGGKGKLISGTGEEASGYYQNIFEVGLDVVPGVVVFLSNSVSVEASIAVLGLNYKKIDQIKSQVYDGSYVKTGADFKINFFTVGLGINFVI